MRFRDEIYKNYTTSSTPPPRPSTVNPQSNVSSLTHSDNMGSMPSSSNFYLDPPNQGLIFNVGNAGVLHHHIHLQQNRNKIDDGFHIVSNPLFPSEIPPHSVSIHPKARPRSSTSRRPKSAGAYTSRSKVSKNSMQNQNQNQNQQLPHLK